MPLVQPAGFTSVFGGSDAGGYNPLDSTVYYTGAFYIFDLDGSYGSHAIKAFQNCRITAARAMYIKAGAGTPSTHQVTYAIRVNDTTDYVIGTQAWDASTATEYVALSIPLQRGDLYAWKITTPAWSTNPVTVFNSFQVWYEIP